MPFPPTTSGTPDLTPGEGFFPLYMDATPGDAPPIDPDAPLGLKEIDITFFEDDMADNPRVFPRYHPRPGATSAVIYPDSNQWFMDEWWIFPRPVEFGNIVTDKTITVEILNTFRLQASHEFSSVDLSALSGVTNTLDLPPFDIRFLEALTTDFTAAAAGEATFDANSIFTFDNAIIPVRMTGTRVILFLFTPEKPITEQLSFKTDIMRNRDQSEQRHGLRVVPRQIVDFDYKPQTEVDRAALRNILRTSQGLLLGIPEWWDERPILNPSANDIPIGVTVIPCNPDFAMFFAGRSALIILPDDTVIDVAIFSVQAGVSVTLAQATTVPIPLGSAILPLATGFLQGSPGLSDYPVKVQQTNLGFQLFSTEDLAFTEAEFQANDFFEKHPVDGLLVMSDPNVIDSVTFSHELIMDRTTVDSGVGLLDVKTTDLLGIPVRSKGVLIHSREDIWQWKQLLHYLYGSWRAFYLPTFQRDLPVVDAGYDLSSGTIDIKDVGLTDLGFDPPYRDVHMRLDDGRSFTRRITSIIDNGDGTESVSLSSSPTVVSEVIAPEDILISFALLCRIEGDIATFVHEYLGEATLRMKVRGLAE